MWTQFLLQNAHFAVNLFAALVLFAVFWLYFDAWQVRKTTYGLFRLIGFVLLSISFVIHAASVESSIVITPVLTSAMQELLVTATRIPAYIFLLISVLAEPLEPHPTYATPAVFVPVAVTIPVIALSHVLYPILAACVGLVYLRRATIGLEDHIKPVAYAFFLLALFEFFGLGVVFRDSNNLKIFTAVSPFGLIWCIEHGFLLVSSIVFGKWIFGYLLKQFSAQLLMILTTTTLVIFLFTTLAFTGLLVGNIEKQTLNELETNVRVLQFTIESKRIEVLSDAQVTAQNPEIIRATREKTRVTLVPLIEMMLLAKKESSLMITSDTGVVLARAEERERIGDSLSNDPLVKRALLGESVTSIVTKSGVVAPSVFVYGASPIRDGAAIVGVVVTGSAIDTAFVDGMKQATGLESTIYGDAVISATTLTAPDGINRLIGITMNRTDITSRVLRKNEKYAGSLHLANTPYFGAFLPLTDLTNNPVGMVFVGKPQSASLGTAGRSIEVTFLVTVLLLVASIIPTYYISRYITKQI